jgi:hypothetical protein
MVNPMAVIQKFLSSRHFLARSPILSSGLTSGSSTPWPPLYVRNAESGVIEKEIGAECRLACKEKVDR